MVSFRFVSSFQTFVVCPIVATGGACHRRFCTPIDSPRSWSGGWIRKNSRPMPNPRDAPTLAGATSGRSSSPVSRLGSGRVDSPSARIVPDPLPGRHAPASWGATGASARSVIGADARGLRPRLPAVPCGSVVSVRTARFLSGTDH